MERRFWIDVLERAWRTRSLIWLRGVRRVGKTTLAQSLKDVEYFDCELPRTRRLMEDPEGFLEGLRGRRVVLDEIHRLANPSELLKIGADHFPDTRILATGSSTLAATAKFRDALAGRKADVWLTPILCRELAGFGHAGLERRLLRGGLPPFFLAAQAAATVYQEWMDAYWAKDVQELFRLERRQAFLRLLELVLARSGGIFEATYYARACEVSRQTITNYLAALETTMVAHVVRPWSTHRATEIVSAPKVYGFDTGFVCVYRGWDALRLEDRGLLWEHVVLNELHARLQAATVHYWRDKAGHEVDFVIARPGAPPIAIECKWSADGFDAAGLRAFRRHYAEGANYVVAQDVSRGSTRRLGELSVHVVSLEGLLDAVAPEDRQPPPRRSPAAAK